tara:strand:+ start:1704 stop:2840 length:1137 start_codon:yes stop_codon:yes gene_type:complete
MSSENMSNFKPGPETVKKITNAVTTVSYSKYKIEKSIYQLPTQTKIAIIVCGIIIIFIMFYYLIYKKTSKNIHTTFLTELDKSEDPWNAKNPYIWTDPNSSTIKKNYIPLSQLGIGGNEYTISFWIYPIGSKVNYISNDNDWSYLYGKWKHILHVGSESLSASSSSPPKFQSPGFWLSPKLNRLNVMFDTLSVNSKERVVIDNLNLNSWTNVTAVLDNTSVGIYLNGRLEKTITIRYNLEKLDNTSNMYLCQNGGFAGFLSYVQAYQNPLEPDQVYNIYKNFKQKIDKWYYSKMDNNDIAAPIPIDISCSKDSDDPSGGGGEDSSGGGGGNPPSPGDNTYGCNTDTGICEINTGSQSYEDCSSTCSIDPSPGPDNPCD